MKNNWIFTCVMGLILSKASLLLGQDRIVRPDPRPELKHLEAFGGRYQPVNCPERFKQIFVLVSFSDASDAFVIRVQQENENPISYALNQSVDKKSGVTITRNNRFNYDQDELIFSQTYEYEDHRHTLQFQQYYRFDSYANELNYSEHDQELLDDGITTRDITEEDRSCTFKKI